MATLSGLSRLLSITAIRVSPDHNNVIRWHSKTFILSGTPIMTKLHIAIVAIIGLKMLHQPKNVKSSF